MPTLVLVRHAKSAYPEGVIDHDRPLNERGEREAQLMASRFRDRLGHLDVDLALISTAQRAQQTWAAVRDVWVNAVSEDRPELYLAGVTRLLSDVQQLSDAAQVVALVGHNEGLEELAATLAAVPVTMKTSTFAVLTSDEKWPNWSPGTATLAEVVVAR